VEHFLEKFGKAFGKKGIKVSEDTMEILLQYQWPGNVRELENAIQRAVVMCKGKLITPELLPEHIRPAEGPQERIQKGAQEETLDLSSRLEELEKKLIMEALSRAGGRRQEAARLLNVTRQTLHNKILKYGLEGWDEM